MGLAARPDNDRFSFRSCHLSRTCRMKCVSVHLDLKCNISLFFFMTHSTAELQWKDGLDQLRQN